MKRLLAHSTLILLLFYTASQAADTDKQSAIKEALQELNEYIGDWKGVGNPEAPGANKSELWKEMLSWSWRFKGDDAWLTMEVKNGKHFKAGELRYLPDKKRYQLTLTDKDSKKVVFDGVVKGGYLTLQRTDPMTM